MQNTHVIKIACLVQVIKSSGKLAYHGVKMTSLNQKHEIAMKVADLCVSKLGISLKDIKLLGKLPNSV